MDSRFAAPAETLAPPTTDRRAKGEATIRGPNGQLLIPASVLAQKLGISTRTLRRLELQGKLPAPLRIGRSVRWSVSLIDQWLDAGAPAQARSKQKGPQSRPGSPRLSGGAGRMSVLRS